MTFPDDWPGVGPVPEPEAEGFRDEQIKAEKDRQAVAAQEQQKRNDDAKAFYSGETATPVETPTTTTYSSKSSKSSKS